MLHSIGWNDDTSRAFARLSMPDAIPARVAAVYGASYRLWSQDGELNGEIGGRLRHLGETERGGPRSLRRERAEPDSPLSADDALPAVGDWVAARPGDPAIILSILPRRTVLTRAAAGTRQYRQTLAANVDFALLVCGLDHDFNPRRLERYLVTSWEGGVAPVVVLNKADRRDDVADVVHHTRDVCGGAPVHAVSALEGSGVEALDAYLHGTTVLLGSSGAGKSTLINRILQRELQRTQGIREDDSRGRHTTTRRDMLRVPGGGVIIDTPGMRELHLSSGDAALGDVFGEVATIASACRFRDCAHEAEPGCAVRDALESGGITEARWTSYRKLQREIRHQRARSDDRARREEQRRAKDLARAIREQTRGS